ncbi:MAG: DMT family transporter [Armatimonadota bacterium]|jgi:drug/metabolite transporter (DMT)-like permease
MPDEPTAAPDGGDAIEQRCGAVLDPVLLSVALVWGGNFVAYKYLMGLIAPSGLLAVRYVLITAILLGVLEWRGQLRTGNSRGMWLRLGIAGVLIMGLQQIAFVTGLNLTAAGEGSLLFATAPIFTALIAAAVGQERITRGNWLGIMAAMGGCVMVILGGAGAQHVPETRVLGDLLMLGSSLGYAAFMVVSKPLMRRYGALKTVTLAYLFGLLIVLPFGGGEAVAADWGSLGSAGWFSMAWLVLLAGAYGFVAWYWRISRTTPSRVAVYQYIVPVIAMIAAAVLLAERPAAMQIAGAALVLLGLYFARRPAVTCPS